MALGGGSFVSYNKSLPGVYINFISNGSVSVFGERGIGVIGYSLSWFDEKATSISKEEFSKECFSIFGDEAENLSFATDFFKNGKELIFGSINSGGKKAVSDIGVAKKFGERGNFITVKVTKSQNFSVLTYVGEKLIDSQEVSAAGELIDNEFVAFNKEAELVSKSYEFTGGSNGKADLAGVQRFLNCVESFYFNCICIVGDFDEYVSSWVKEMREDFGRKFQAIISGSKNPNYEGVIFTDIDKRVLPWICGACCGCNINQSLTNFIYNGEAIDFDELFESLISSSQKDIIKKVKEGVFTFHCVGKEIRVVKDINSFTNFSKDKSQDFSLNQVIRVLDQIGNDIANIFNTYYCGKVANDKDGRNSLWKDIVKHCESLQDIRAIENFSDESCEVQIGKDKTSVIVKLEVEPCCAMDTLYMTVIVE